MLFLLEKTLYKDYKEPYSSTIITYSPEMKSLFLMVRNEIRTTPTTVILSLYIRVKSFSPKKKRKN